MTLAASARIGGPLREEPDSIALFSSVVAWRAAPRAQIPRKRLAVLQEG